MTKKPQLHDTISRLLETKLRHVVDSGSTLNKATCTQIYTTVFSTLAEVLTSAEAPVSNEGINYLAQQYYDGILINGNQELDPNIFTQRAKLENIDTRELALLAMMMRGTDFALPLIAEIKKRS